MSRYVKLRLIDSDNRDRAARIGGWKNYQEMLNELRESMIGYWYDFDNKQVKGLPRNVSKTNLYPILIIVSARVFAEQATAYLSKNGKVAYIEAETYSGLW